MMNSCIITTLETFNNITQLNQNYYGTDTHTDCTFLSVGMLYMLCAYNVSYETIMGKNDFFTGLK
jgi:hypothetical protein